MAKNPNIQSNLMVVNFFKGKNSNTEIKPKIVISCKKNFLVLRQPLILQSGGLESLKGMLIL